MASVKVAVRVRPFNQRERDLNSTCIIRMEANKTIITNPRIDANDTSEISVLSNDSDFLTRVKEFTYDYSYDSLEPDDPMFVDQHQIYDDLGREVVMDSLEGYNTCVFAYGQTGSGKTFTMMGTPASEGLIPKICRQLFNKMKEGRNTGCTYRTEVSYLEIYNEKVKDLLTKSEATGLKVREHPKLGPYVQDLSKHIVMDYSDLEELMSRGNAQRTTASTAMNDTSSRSHAIFTIAFSQASFAKNTPRETLSKINLVDLAGSERVNATGATGRRLKEGCHINKSLVTLGSVIKSLADSSKRNTSYSRRRAFIPYRDSVLTWLLKDSLGGNSKTVMIATISPADCNYSETLSTLRYANRAKNIVNKPTINEDGNTKLIRELRMEIKRLTYLLDEHPTMIGKLQENEAKVKILTEEWTEKWKETHKILREQKTLGLRKSGRGVVLDSDLPHLVGIDDDLLSTGITLYHLKEGLTRIGAESSQDIVLHGVDIEDEHCNIELKGGTATLCPIDGALCSVNMTQIDKPTKLSQGCVILLGENTLFRYNDPVEVEKLRRVNERGSCLNLSRVFGSSCDFFRTPDSMTSSYTVNDMSFDEGSSDENNCNTTAGGDSDIENKKRVLDELIDESELIKKLIDDRKSELKLFNAKSKDEVICFRHEMDTADDSDEDINKYKSNHLNGVTEDESHNTLNCKTDELKGLFVKLGHEIENCYKEFLVRTKKHAEELKSNEHLNRINTKFYCDDLSDLNLLINQYIDNPSSPISVLNDLRDIKEKLDILSLKAELMCPYPASFNSNCDSNANLIYKLNSNVDTETDVESVTNLTRNTTDECLQTVQTDEISNIDELIETEVSRRLNLKLAELEMKWKEEFESRLSVRPAFVSTPNLYESPATVDHELSMWPIYIEVPTYILVDSHYEYRINIHINHGKESWSINRRYRRFRELHLHMQRKYKGIHLPKFPPRKIFGNKSSGFLEFRRKCLETYINELMTTLQDVPNSPLNFQNLSRTCFRKDDLYEVASFFRNGRLEDTVGHGKYNPSAKLDLF